MKIKKLLGNDKLHIFLLFMVSFFVHAFVLNQFICWFSTDTDGYWLHAATFLGKDWSGVAKHMNNYYSWGYSVLLTIPMLLTDVPSRLCKLAVLINSGLCALIVPMAYDIMRKVSRKVGHGEALLGAFVVSVYSTYILESSVSLSESLIYFLTFFIFWCLVRFNQSGRLIWGMLSGFAVGYVYIVHNRNLSIVVAFAVVVLVYCVREKRAKKAVAMTVPVAVMWILKLFVDKWLIAKEATGGVYTSNTYSSIADRYTNDFTLYRLISIFENVIGEAWYTYIGTMLIGGVGIYYIIKQLILCKKSGTESGKKKVELYLFAFLSWLFSVGISVLFVARGQVSYGGRIDNLIYGRYMENTVGILMLYGFIYGIELRKEQNRKDIRNKIIIMAMLAVILTSVTYILSLKSDPHKCNWFSIVAILMPLFKSDMKVPIVLSGMILGLLGIGVFLCITGSKKRCVVLGYLVMAVTFIYIGYNTTACVSQIYAEGKSLVNNPTYNEHFNDICGYIKNSDIDQLYVYTTDGYEAFSYQFVNNHMVVIGITGEEELDTISSDALVLMKTAEIPKDISYEVIYANGLYSICHINLNINTEHAIGHAYSDFVQVQEGTPITILWLGTSIPMGNEHGNYPELVSELLGENVTIFNISKSAGIARAGSYKNISETDTLGYEGYRDNFRMLMKSFSLSQKEKQSIYDNWSNWSDQFTYDGSFDTKSDNMKLYLSCSYDGDLKKYLEKYKIDYVVYDVGYNDAAVNNYTDTAEISDCPAVWGDRTYYIGASEFIFDKIHEYSPDTQIIIAGHYSKDDYPFVGKAQEELSSLCNVPIYKTWEETGWTTDIIEVTGTWQDGYWIEDGQKRECTVIESWCPDGIHPGNDYSQKANTYLAEIHANMLKKIIYK